MVALGKIALRVRFKVDWNSKDPNGCTDPTNKLSANAGTICDFTINVNKEVVTAIQSLQNEVIKVFFAKGNLQIQGLDGSAKVSIYTVAGQLIETFKANSNSVVKPLNLNKGIYIIAIKQQGKTHSYKISL